MSNSKFAIREAVESDFPFIYSTWLKGLRFGAETYGWIDQNTYFKKYHDVIEKILERPGVVVIVACLKDDPMTILGYVVREGMDTLHYVHVKQAFRNFGIARELCAGDIKTVTHLTKMGANLLKEKLPGAVFNPFL